MKRVDGKLFFITFVILILFVLFYSKGDRSDTFLHVFYCNLLFFNLPRIAFLCNESTKLKALILLDKSKI